MQAMDDMALLREYATRNSEAAFAELVSRRGGFVYSAALRQVRDPHLAGEITQVVFIILAQKAGRISDKTNLTGWLFKTTRFTALAQMRAAAKRQRREQEAQMQSEFQSTVPDALWEQMSPMLDEALATLGEKDRQAVLLRFFENKNLAEVGISLGAGEDTARKRVSRALEKLRKFFSKRGVVSTSAIIAGAMSANSVHAAPAVLAKSVAAVAIAKGVAASGSTLILIKGALKIMAWTKVKTAVVAGAVLILAAGTTTVIVKRSGHRHPPVTLQWTPAEAESFKQQSIARANEGKQWALAFLMFANDHRSQFPKDFDQVKTGRYVRDLPDSNWEVVSSGNLTSFGKPAETVLLRENESRQSPDGNFVKAYVFTDGHVEIVSSPDGDFAAVEKQRGFLLRPAK